MQRKHKLKLLHGNLVSSKGLYYVCVLLSGAEGADQNAGRMKISEVKMQSVVANKFKAANFERSSSVVQAQDYSSELACDAGSVAQYQVS